MYSPNRQSNAASPMEVEMSEGRQFTSLKGGDDSGEAGDDNRSPPAVRGNATIDSEDTLEKSDDGSIVDHLQESSDVTPHKLSAVSPSSDNIKASSEFLEKVVTGSPMKATAADITLTWSSLTYKVVAKNEPAKILIHGVDGDVNPGEVICIMGSSGAGKTVSDIQINLGKSHFLQKGDNHLLCRSRDKSHTSFGLIGRVDSGKISGEILVNGKRRARTWGRVCGYVEQDDIMYPMLTVRETIEFAALQRLPRTLSSDEKINRARQILLKLGLIHTADTRIGDAIFRGISGGERKRVAIGVELVTDPKVLFLDEPTSGLDSATAFNIVHSIKEIAVRERKTVIMTIHQPRYELFALFDRCYLMSQGRTVFFGKAEEALGHFASLGYPCPPRSNPADLRTEASTNLTTDRVLNFAQRWKEKTGQSSSKKLVTAPSTDLNQIPDALDALVNSSQVTDSIIKLDAAQNANLGWPQLWIFEFWNIFKRNIRQKARNPVVVIAGLGQSIIMTFLIGFTFFKVSDDQTGIQSRVGMLFFTGLNLLYANMMPILQVFTTERAIIMRERASTTYRASTVYVAKALSEIPLTFAFQSVYFVCIYFMIGFQLDISKFGIFLATSYSMVFCAQAMGLFVGASAPTVQLASIIGPLLLVVLTVVGGYLVQPESIPWPLRWISYVSFLKYSYYALTQNEFSGLEFTCPPTARACLTTGDAVMEQYRLQDYSIGVCIGSMLVIAFGMHVLAYLGLRKNTKPRMKLT